MVVVMVVIVVVMVVVMVAVMVAVMVTHGFGAGAERVRVCYSSAADPHA